MTERRAKCSACRWWDGDATQAPDGSTPPAGWCRMLPPQPAGFPLVSPNAWCGSFDDGGAKI